MSQFCSQWIRMCTTVRTDCITKGSWQIPCNILLYTTKEIMLSHQAMHGVDSTLRRELKVPVTIYSSEGICVSAKWVSPLVSNCKDSFSALKSIGLDNPYTDSIWRLQLDAKPQIFMEYQAVHPSRLYHDRLWFFLPTQLVCCHVSALRFVEWQHMTWPFAQFNTKWFYQAYKCWHENRAHRLQTWPYLVPSLILGYYSFWFMLVDRRYHCYR